MRTRRDFVRDATAAVAGLLAAGSGSVPVSAQPPAGQRRRTIVGGRQVKTIDVHSHVVIPRASAVMNRAVSPTDAQGITPELLNVRLKTMDGYGIDVQAVSVNPFWYGTDRMVAEQLIRIQNEELARLHASHPDRLVALASVALQHPDLAAAQLEEAVKTYGMRGAAIGGSVEGEELSSPRFDPFWAKAEALGALIFIHPQNAPGRPTARLQGNGVLNNVIGNPLETTIALSHLIFEGTLDRFPGLKICAAHGGGYLPSYAARSDHGCKVFPEQCTKTLKRQPSEYLRHLYFDTLVFTPEGLRHLVAETGVSQLMIGTDYPFPWTSTPVDHVLSTPGLSDADRIAILGGNAAKLLGIPT